MATASPSTIFAEPAQVATDTRLWLYKELQQVQAALHDLIRASVDRAEADVEVLMPGFTHLQVDCAGMQPEDGICSHHLAQGLFAAGLEPHRGGIEE